MDERAPTAAAEGAQEGAPTRWIVSSADRAILEAIFRECRFPSAELRRFIAKLCDVTPVQVRVWFHNRRHREKCKTRGRGGADIPLNDANRPVDEGPIIQWLSRLVQARQQLVSDHHGRGLAIPGLPGPSLIGPSSPLPGPAWGDLDTRAFRNAASPLCHGSFDTSQSLGMPSLPDASSMSNQMAMWPAVFANTGAAATPWDAASCAQQTHLLNQLAQQQQPGLAQGGFGMMPHASYPSQACSLMGFPNVPMPQRSMDIPQGLPGFSQSVSGRGQGVLGSCSDAFASTSSSMNAAMRAAGVGSSHELGVGNGMSMSMGALDRDREQFLRNVRPRQ